MKNKTFRMWLILGLCLAITVVFNQAVFSQTTQQEKLKQGIEFFEAGKTAEAKAIFDQLIAQNYVNNELYYYLGSALIKQKNPEAALTYFNKILQSDPNSPYGYIGKAQYYMSKGNFTSAEPQLNTAIQKDPNCAEAYYQRGLLRGGQKKIDQAIADLQKCLQLKGNHAYAHYNIGLAYNQKGRKDLMITHFHKFVYLAPEAPEAAQVKSLLSRI
ncbi:MAG: tetratricopeptide repeat protein [Candidatus Saccharicenans sp.]|nr:tetratricopeptide repeat protein [Candidatus Saccharicenans sp.]